MNPKTDEKWEWFGMRMMHHCVPSSSCPRARHCIPVVSNLSDFYQQPLQIFVVWKSRIIKNVGVRFHRATLNFIFDYAATKHMSVLTPFLCAYDISRSHSGNVLWKRCTWPHMSALFFHLCVKAADIFRKYVEVEKMVCWSSMYKDKDLLKNVNSVVLPKYCSVCLSGPRAVSAKPIVGVCWKIKDGECVWKRWSKTSFLKVPFKKSILQVHFI